MSYSEFVKSGRQVFRIGFGAMGLGGVFGYYDDDYFIRSVHSCLEQGVNFIDTARAYGKSEELIGKALQTWPGEKPFIATKALATPSPVDAPWLGWQEPVSAKYAYPKGSIRASAEQSLKLLGVEEIDLLQLHQYWAWESNDDWMEEMLRLKEEGKVRHIGISLPDHRHDLALQLVRSGLIDSVQTIINIFDPLALDCLVPICQENGVAVIARAILDEAGLTGAIGMETEIEKTDYRYQYFDCVPREVYIERVNRLKPFIPEHADSLAELAIKFVLHHPGISVALTSMHVHEYAVQNIAAAGSTPLPAEVFEQLRHKHRFIKNFYQARRHV
ncbi:aldo/keto reductase [Ammoniphilus sp. YIM 78166]|uniref:aldo/keto reductase n=1 Tax=Ammoniphilus sp. YIM 78166 TaxID=1644106 RepID=UPI00106F2E5B|nr:aldo/keto reductase [Ammoniphilus sp. YIM 78166]